MWNYRLPCVVCCSGVHVNAVDGCHCRCSRRRALCLTPAVSPLTAMHRAPHFRCLLNCLPITIHQYVSCSSRISDTHVVALLSEVKVRLRLGILRSAYRGVQGEFCDNSCRLLPVRLRLGILRSAYGGVQGEFRGNRCRQL
jgi:hypothetical protein